MASPAILSWTRSTVLIENESGKTSTGFLVHRQLDEESGQAYLVSNKHVLNETQSLRIQAREIMVSVNMREKDGTVVGKRGIFPLHYEDSTRKWREHPDVDVDIIAFDATSMITHFPELDKRMAEYSTFADERKIAEHDIDIGDDVIVVGYPLGLTQGGTNHPIVRTGIIASRIGEKLQLDGKGQTEYRSHRGFIIDGGTVPGSSGSPVILKPIMGRYVHNRIEPNVAPALLLGIISETFYASVQTETSANHSFAGLGLVLEADTIKETIELFHS